MKRNTKAARDPSIPMTVRELREALASIPEETPVFGAWEGQHIALHEVTHMDETVGQGPNFVLLDVDSY